MIPDPARSEAESIRLDLEASKGDIGRLLDVLRRLVELRRRGALALDLERELGRRLLGKGEPLLACGALTGALRAQRARPGDPRLRQLRGLVLARLGETRRACRELESLAREPYDDPRLIEETFGILARTYKDPGFEYRATNPARTRKYWRRSFRHYNGAYAKTGSYYPGINAATLALLLGAPRQACELAERVLGDCLERWKTIEAGDRSAGDDLYWLAATMGEAALILGKTQEATRWYHDLKRNTWGDAVYLVLPDVRAAGRLALDIRDRLRETRWAEYDLPPELTMRIGLHAGPTYRCLDPVTKRDRFLGSHISLAARIEPIVRPGRVYTSQAFAVLAAESGVTEFTCRYLGLKALPKHAGTVPVYALERSRNR